MRHLVATARMRVVHSAGTMNVYRRKGMGGVKPFVVGTERLGRLVLLEEFDLLDDAKRWTEDNKGDDYGDQEQELK